MLKDELKNIPGTSKDLRNFGLVVGGVAAAIGGYLLWKNSEFAPILLGFGGFLIVFGLIFPTALKPLQRAWMTLAVIMGFVMTRVLLSLLFFLVMTPIGWIAKLTGKQFLDVQWQPGKSQSYWKYRDKQSIDSKSFEQQF